MKTSPLSFGSRIHLRSDEHFKLLIDRARFLEEHDYDTLVLDDHLLYGTSTALALDPFSTSTAVALETRKIRIGVAVTDLVRRHPAILAQTVGTLSTIIGQDRFFLGLGTGDPMNHSPFGLPVDHRFERFKEGVLMLKMLWSSSIEKPVTCKGRFHHLTNAYLQTGPNRPLPQLYFAAFGKRMLQFTGEEADGWIPHCHTPETYQKDLAKITEAAKRAGMSHKKITPSYYTLASVAMNRDIANAHVLGPARYFLALIPEALKKIDSSVPHPGRIWETETDPRKQREIIRKIAATIPQDIALKTTIHGTPADCIEQVSLYQKQGCREFLLTFTPPSGLWSGDDALEMQDLFAEKVLKYFREEND
ncbi:MAG TPA: LLM class flavin-dependent oxidoreductase [Candidatus Binatus sp.]|nr:LLM class flavin-dependent oxidoreductase [Candidatus Binatus sp.]